MILPGMDLDGAAAAAERIRRGLELRPSPRFGALRLPERGAGLERVLGLARQSMSARSWAEHNWDRSYDVELLFNAMEALKRPEEAEVERRAVHSLADGRVLGYELLCRFKQPPIREQRDLRALAARENLLSKLEECLLRAELRCAREIDHSLDCFVRLSPETVLSLPLGSLESMLPPRRNPRRISLILDASGLSPYGHALPRAAQRVRQMGLSLALENFPMEASALNRLPELGPDALILGSEFSRLFFRDPERQAELRCQLGRLRAADCAVICRGVDSEEDLEAMKACGLRYGQGILWELRQMAGVA
jgi:EAL domain-containing protein (putative c-di-GMP-specific phosphodiesterase class I)